MYDSMFHTTLSIYYHIDKIHDFFKPWFLYNLINKNYVLFWCNFDRG